MNPVLKYRGGKSREIPRFLQYIPDDFDRYIEPFFGGGAVYFYFEPDNAIIGEPLPSKKPVCANRSINSTCVCLFHFRPAKFSFNNFISGIILDGVRGDVVKNKALFLRYAICQPSILSNF